MNHSYCGGFRYDDLNWLDKPDFLSYVAFCVSNKARVKRMKKRK